MHLQEPDTTSHRRTGRSRRKVWSLLHEAMTVPSAEKATVMTPELHNLGHVLQYLLALKQLVLTLLALLVRIRLPVQVTGPRSFMDRMHLHPALY